jgi:2-polyprenyl-3-methyl-5-hydroxy-6-metoxy-1,4-benzoquinol methylase
MQALVHDMAKEPLPHRFDGIYALDVIEHISPANEERFLDNISKSLIDVGGIVIIGTPSLESQMYASPISRAGHVNCYSGVELRRRMSKWFHVVLMFSMNDEVVHTGFDKMANYLFAVCCEKRK